jgi:hypothetical protein
MGLRPAAWQPNGWPISRLRWVATMEIVPTDERAKHTKIARIQPVGWMGELGAVVIRDSVSEYRGFNGERAFENLNDQNTLRGLKLTFLCL